MTKVLNEQGCPHIRPAATDNIEPIFRPAEHRDFEAVWRLYADNFGAHGLRRLKKRWQWQFVDNPACREQQPSIWVAEIKGNVVAQIAAFPVRMKVMDKEMIIQWESHLVVDQEARRLNPIWPLQFIRKVLKENPSPLTGGSEFLFMPVKGTSELVSPHMRLREEWLSHRRVFNNSIGRRTCSGDYRLRLISSKGNIAKRLVEWPVGRTASWALRLAIHIYNQLYHTPPGDPDLIVRRIQRSGPEFDTLWARVRAKFPITTVRDRVFIDWRFFEDPVFENVLFGAYNHKGELQGYIAVRTGHTDEGPLVGRVIDLFCDPDDDVVATTLFRAGIKWLEQFKIEVITCRGIFPRLRPSFRKFFYRTVQFEDASLHSPSLYNWTGASELAEAIYDAKNWHYTYADGLGGLSP